MKLLLSSSTKDSLEKSLNNFFYSTTYKLIDNGAVVWKVNEVKDNLIWKQEKNRFKIFQV